MSTARGFRLATSVGGTLTGRGGDIVVIDDPLKPDDAFSETKRSAANQWFTNTLLSRLDDKRTGAIVVVMQRVHMDDLTGFLLQQSDEWEVLSLPAIAPADEVVPGWAGHSHRRLVGEALSEREPVAVLNALKLSDRQRRVLGAISADAGAAGRRHGQARLDQAVCGPAAGIGAGYDGAELGYSEQGRA